MASAVGAAWTSAAGKVAALAVAVPALMVATSLPWTWFIYRNERPPSPVGLLELRAPAPDRRGVIAHMERQVPGSGVGESNPDAGPDFSPPGKQSQHRRRRIRNSCVHTFHRNPAESSMAPPDGGAML